MKKIKTLLITLCLAAIPITVFAAEGQWVLLNTNTEIYGNLRAESKNTCRAFTQRISGNNYGVYCKTYATRDGQTISDSISIQRSEGSYVVSKSTAYGNHYWGSGHSTAYTNDEYQWLWLEA